MEKTIARIISWIFNPLFVPTYAVAMMFACTDLRFLPNRIVFAVVGVTLLLSGILPLMAILALKAIKMVRDVDLQLRPQRTIPYGFTLLCYIALAVFLIRSHAMWWMMSFIYGGISSLLIVAIINLKWKISAHLAALGGILAAAVTMAVVPIATIPMLWVVIAIVLVMGCVASCRIILDCHTPMQLLAGAFVGFCCTGLTFLIYGS